MDIIKVVTIAKRHYDEMRLKSIINKCRFPAGCTPRMILGSGVLEIVYESQSLVDSFWRSYRAYIPIDALVIERLCVKVASDKNPQSVSVEKLLLARNSREAR